MTSRFACIIIKPHHYMLRRKESIMAKNEKKKKMRGGAEYEQVDVGGVAVSECIVWCS